MLLGQILFVFAAFTIAGATALGLIIGIARLVAFKVLGRRLAPAHPPGSLGWMLEESETTVDTATMSLLTERRRQTPRDPIVNLAGTAYRVTRLGSSRFLVTQLDEGRRLGMFELDGDGRRQKVLSEPDDPANARLIVQVAVLASVERTGAT
jgi:hypothetical protein